MKLMLLNSIHSYLTHTADKWIVISSYEFYSIASVSRLGISGVTIRIHTS